MNLYVINLTGGVTYYEQGSVAFSVGTAVFFAASSPLKPGDSLIVALGQNIHYLDGSYHLSKNTFQTTVAPITVLI